MKILDKVFREKDIQGPMESDAQFFFEAWEFQKVNRLPESPGGESRENNAKHSGDTGVPADRQYHRELIVFIWQGLAPPLAESLRIFQVSPSRTITQDQHPSP